MAESTYVHHYETPEERWESIREHEGYGQRMVHDDNTPGDPEGSHRLIFEIPIPPLPPTQLEAEIDTVRAKLESDPDAVLTPEEVTSWMRWALVIDYPPVARARDGGTT